ncbi:helicase-like protein, partial [Trifolium medium]|nr:helicase-like protein [Trifolium medium]
VRVGESGEAWVWRRQLRVWEEEMLGEYQFLLLNISMQAQSSDRWQWQPDPEKGFGYFGCCRRSHLAHSGSFEGFHLSVATLT